MKLDIFGVLNTYCKVLTDITLNKAGVLLLIIDANLVFLCKKISHISDRQSPLIDPQTAFDSNDSHSEHFTSVNRYNNYNLIQGLYGLNTSLRLHFKVERFFNNLKYKEFIRT